MNKKCAIITITSGTNYGNRLQNYAVQKVLQDIGLEVETLINEENNDNYIYKLKRIIKLTFFRKKYKKIFQRIDNFDKFNKQYIDFSKFKISNKNIPKDIENNYDYFIAGSDQIWNLNDKKNNIVNFMGFVKNKTKIAFAPSFGASNIPKDISINISKWINEIDFLSVREDAGKEIIKKLTGRTDAKVLIDPTMLLTDCDWEVISKKPIINIPKKYILNYFLGNLSNEREKEIKRVAKENNCEIINILDLNDKYYSCGPSEFLYLVKNAFLVCTDSFHSSVFSIIYKKPFIVFDRDSAEKSNNMNSRIDTLLNKFNLNDRRYNENQITLKNLKIDYKLTMEILNEERKKSIEYLKQAINRRKK